jgi:hypothetical protein
LLGEIGWLGCCLCHRYKFADKIPLDLSINQAKQQTSILRIGTHILSESSKDNTQTPYQTRYQLNSHLQSNSLELDDKAQTLSYEHYFPYGGTAIIALVIINIVLCGFVCFGEFVKGIVVIPL